MSRAGGEAGADSAWGEGLLGWTCGGEIEASCPEHGPLTERRPCPPPLITSLSLVG